MTLENEGAVFIWNGLVAEPPRLAAPSRPVSSVDLVLVDSVEHARSHRKGAEGMDEAVDDAVVGSDGAKT
jgi:hypothetical protein